MQIRRILFGNEDEEQGEMADQGGVQQGAGAAVMDAAAIQALVQQAVQAAIGATIPQLQ